jgi:hypothetical protein
MLPPSILFSVPYLASLLLVNPITPVIEVPMVLNMGVVPGNIGIVPGRVGVVMVFGDAFLSIMIYRLGLDAEISLVL